MYSPPLYLNQRMYVTSGATCYALSALNNPPLHRDNHQTLEDALTYHPPA